MDAQHRYAHVVRLYQTDDQGNVVDPDVWLDVLRIDKFFASEPRGQLDGDSHGVREYVILWGDDTPASWHIPPRRLNDLTVIQPSDTGGPPDPRAPSVDIPLIERTMFNFRGPPKKGKKGETHNAVIWVFKNMPDKERPTGRKSTIVRITNNDLDNAIKMPVPSAGDPQPPTKPAIQDGGGVPWGAYAKALQDGIIDDSQYVDVEVTDRFNVRFPPPYFKGHIVTYVLKQKQDGDGPPGPEDLFQAPPSKGGAPWRTDPFQTIVNVSWGGGAVEFGDKAQDAPGDGGG